jgi:hypothetical protein
MRLDREHVRTLARAFEVDKDGERVIKINTRIMRAAIRRLSMWEAGLLSKALARSAAAPRPTIEQRTLLALFAYREGDR